VSWRSELCLLVQRRVDAEYWIFIWYWTREKVLFDWIVMEMGSVGGRDIRGEVKL
jgi:hypothetical protein